MRSCALTLAARLVEQKLNADCSDLKGATIPCRRGNKAHFVESRQKTFITALGEMKLSRIYYHCESCKSGFYPRDRSLNLEHTSLFPAIRRIIGIAVARVSFAETGELLWKFAAVGVDTKQVERSAESLGRQIAQDEQCNVEVEPSDASTLYLGMDGTGIPVRKCESAGRPGKQPDGSAKNREVKIVALWSADRRDSDNLATIDPGSVSYCVAIESASTLETDKMVSAFARRGEREAPRRDFQNAERQVVIGDRAKWIWNIASSISPKRCKSWICSTRHNIFGMLAKTSMVLALI